MRRKGLLEMTGMSPEKWEMTEKFIGERKKLMLAGMKGRYYASSLAIEKKGLATNYRVSFHLRENPYSLRNFF